MRKFILLLFVFLALQSGAQSSGMHKTIAAVLTDIRAFNKSEWTADSSRAYLLRSHTEAIYERRYRFYLKVQERLKTIDKKTLSFDDEINLELLNHDVLDELSSFRFKAYLNPILSDWGFHTSLAGRANTVIRTKQDADNYIRLLQDFPRYTAEYIQLMRHGLAAGVSQPALILKGYDATYREHLTDTIEKSVFWKPLRQRPPAIPEADWRDFQNRARIAIHKEVIGSYQRLDDFFTSEYAFKTRTAPGVSQIPEGRQYYEDRVRHFTTTSLSSDDVYAIGLKEVERIKKQMDSVILSLRFEGDFKSFINELRTNPIFQPKTAEELLKEAAYIAKKVDGMLPSLFGKLPRQPYTVVPVPAYLAPTFTTGRYSGAPISGTRPGEYWVNTFNLPSRTLYTLEALTLHEAVPGHHLQTSLTQELNNLPEFRRNMYINAFGEGWGLYSEFLGHEMGFYKDPYSLFGRLTYEMWRACRLVIDVGIHTKGWTREQAVSYLADNTALSLHEVNTEVNRYISWPGQALAYKIGEIKIREMRKRTEDALLADFDIRSFHDMILSNGTVTLALLEKMTDRYIRQELEKKKKSS